MQGVVAGLKEGACIIIVNVLLFPPGDFRLHYQYPNDVKYYMLILKGDNNIESK